MKKKKIKGAEVFEPDKGMHKKVIVLDLSKIYPAIMLEGNLSYETYTENENEGVLMPSGHRFKQDKVGLLPRVVKKLFRIEREYKKERKKAKTPDEIKIWDNKIMAIKVFRNSAYGASLNPYFRLYSREVGETVTKFGREILKLVKKTVEDLGYKVVGGDTDSVFVKFPDNFTDKMVVMTGKVISDRVNVKLLEYAQSYGLKGEWFEIEFENYLKPFFIAKKKRYVGEICWEDGEWIENDRKKIRGFEIRRSETPKITQDMQKHVFNLLFSIEDKEKRKKEVIDIVWQYYMDTVDGIFSPHYICRCPSLNLPYDGNPIQKTASENGSEYLGLDWTNGDRVHYVYLKGGTGYKRMGFKYDTELPEELLDDVNWKLMAEKYVLKKAKRIFEGMGWEDEWYSLRERSKNNIRKGVEEYGV